MCTIITSFLPPSPHIIIIIMSKYSYLYINLQHNMTKFNSIKQKIKKRTRKEDNTQSAPPLSSTTPGTFTSFPSHTPPSSTPEPSIQSNLPISEPPKRRKITQTEKNKKKKSKYKLKKKQLNNHNQHNKPTRKNKYFLTTTRRWLWKTRKSDDFTTKQKKSLYKAHHISKIIEQYNSMLFNLQSTISHTSFKNNSGNISFSQLSSTHIYTCNSLGRNRIP